MREVPGPHRPVFLPVCNGVYMNIISLIFIINLKAGFRIGKGK